MKREYGRLYIVGTILFFAIVTVIFLFQLVRIREINEERARTVFNSLAVTAERRWTDFDLPDAAQGLATAFASTSPQPLVIGVYSFDVGVDYLWARDGRFLSDPHYTPFAVPPPITMNDIVHRRFSRTFRLPGGDQRIITAVFPVLDGGSVFPLLRLTLIAILGFLAVVTTIALVHMIPPKSRASRSTPPDHEGPAVVTSEISVADPDRTLNRSHLDALKDKLSLELERAAYQDQDLTVAALVFTGSDGAGNDRNIRAVEEFFGFRDLCFPLPGNEIVTVFPGTSLTDALGQVERFQLYYWERRIEWNAPTADFYCGATARNGRLVNGERMLNESRTAAKRAARSSGKIVGFSPDPQRYREYLMSQSR